MRNPLSKKIIGIEPSGIRKFFDIVSEMPDAISLGVGEPDFDTPWNVREEGIYTLEKGRTFYTSNAGLKELREEISRYVNRKYDLHYDPVHEIFVTVGGSEAIDVALRCMTDPGDEVLIPQPSYVSYGPRSAWPPRRRPRAARRRCRRSRRASGGRRFHDPGAGALLPV